MHSKLVALIAALAGAGVASTGFADTPPGSAQAVYDSAQAALDKDDWSAAAKGFGSLIPPNPGAVLSRSRAVIAGRLAKALVHLGRFDEARVMGERAVASLPPDDPELPDALLTTANAAQAGYDYPYAARLYQRAIAAADKANMLGVSINARAGFAESQATVDPLEVARVLDVVLSDTATASKLDKIQLSFMEDLRARAAMNAGDLEAAASWITRAVDESGGLTTTNVNLAQVAIRTDAAIIHSLRNNTELTRKYLAYTGAGHLPNIDWITTYNGELPVCGSGVKPGETVVVQFSIADDGHVTVATPLYASRPGPMGAAFAQDVSQWQWDPSSLKGVDAFWRGSLVLQLGCQSRPSPDSLATPIRTSLSAWLRSKGVDTSDHPDSFVAADDPRLTMNSPAAIPALLGRMSSHKDVAEIAQRLQAVLDGNNAPAAAYALMIIRHASANAYGRNTYAAQARARASFYEDVVPGFRTRHPDDPATALLLLDWGLALEDSGDFEKAYPLLKAVTAMSVATVPADAPIRQVALLHLALAGEKIGDHDAARILAASGISPDQCSLFDIHPVLESMKRAQFPEEAERWHFEGYAGVGYDVDGDGRPANVHTITAYPPFIFTAASEKSVRTFRYDAPKIGDKPVGCSGESFGMSYRIKNW
jgi:tetratricopeptide (TPR) repeat protein